MSVEYVKCMSMPRAAVLNKVVMSAIMAIVHFRFGSNGYVLVLERRSSAPIAVRKLACENAIGMDVLKKPYE